MKLSDKSWVKPLLKEKKNKLQKLFDEAESLGFTKYKIGHQMGGNYVTNINKIKNPTMEVLEKVEKAIKELKNKRK